MFLHFSLFDSPLLILDFLQPPEPKRLQLTPSAQVSPKPPSINRSAQPPAARKSRILPYNIQPSFQTRSHGSVYATNMLLNPSAPPPVDVSEGELKIPHSIRMQKLHKVWDKMTQVCMVHYVLGREPATMHDSDHCHLKLTTIDDNEWRQWRQEADNPVKTCFGCGMGNVRISWCCSLSTLTGTL